MDYNKQSQSGNSTGHSENTDYKREGVQLGTSSDDNQKNSDPNAGTQHGGGGAGYDAGEENQQIKKEREQMHNERDLDQVNPDRQRTSQPETPGQPAPETPSTNPGSAGKHNVANRSQSGAWSQSSWDPNNTQ